MKKTKGIYRKILRKIYTGLGLTTTALVFQACYGTPQIMGLDVLVQGVVKSETTKAPIKGIRVSVEYQSELTDDSGKFQLYVPREESCTIRLDDVDGAENRSYSSKEIPVYVSENKKDMKDIFLDDAE